MKKLNRLVVATLSALGLFFSVSICASADAQIDMLSAIDNTIHASISGEDATLLVAEYSEGLLSSVFFADSSNGYVELEVGDAAEYKMFLWDRENLAPLSCTYALKEGRAYIEGSQTPLPPYSEAPYTFNQDDNVMVVSRIDGTSISGFKAGEEVTYTFASSVVVLGLSDNLSDVVPGSVVLIGTNNNGNCAAIELLATIGLPVSEDTFQKHFGVYNPSDGSNKYQNVVTEIYGKNGASISTYNPPDTTKTSYTIASDALIFRVGIAMEGETPIISATKKNLFAYPSIFENTALYRNYIYLRYDTESAKVKECVFYCVPKNFNPGKGDGEYSDIFNLEPIVIIE